jgi:hypothetical protein
VKLWTKPNLVAEEATRDVDLLAADDGDLLAREDLLSDSAGQATEQMAFAVDNNGARRERGHIEQSRRMKLWGSEYIILLSIPLDVAANGLSSYL